MLHALELRSPYMDTDLLRFASTLGDAGLLEGTGLRPARKRLLRDAFAAQLPASVFARPKMGFAVPVGDWLRGELREMLRENLMASDSFARENFNFGWVEELLAAHDAQGTGYDTGGQPHPTLAPDGKLVMWTSNMGGSGRFDTFMARVPVR